MSQSSDAAGGPTTQAVAVEQWFRRRTIVLSNRVALALIVVGGVAVGLSAHSRRAMEAAALISLGVAGLILVYVVMRFLGIQRRLSEDPAKELARLASRPGRHQRLLLDDVSSRPSEAGPDQIHPAEDSGGANLG